MVELGILDGENEYMDEWSKVLGTWMMEIQ